jgi:hypothetical protein
MGMFITVNVKTVFWRGNKVKEEKKTENKTKLKVQRGKGQENKIKGLKNRRKLKLISP